VFLSGKQPGEFELIGAVCWLLRAQVLITGASGAASVRRIAPSSLYRGESMWGLLWLFFCDALRSGDPNLLFFFFFPRTLLMHGFWITASLSSLSLSICLHYY